MNDRVPWTQTMRMLLVEDDFAHAKMIRRALASVTDPDEVVHVNDGSVALDYLYRRGAYQHLAADSRPSLVLLDLRLPHVDGIEVLRAMRADAAMREIPVVVLSTSDRPHDIQECYAAGANAFVTKPVDFADFSRKVTEIWHFWESTAELPGASAA